MIDSRH